MKHNKIKPVLILLFIFLLSLTSFITADSLREKRSKVMDEVIGVKPPDMAFIKGNKSLRSFWLAPSEEINYNYRVYTIWTKEQFPDFPEVYTKCLPPENICNDDLTYNDPYISNNFLHPAFSYYPVIGLSWLQIQDYLQWKTDRLNEIILWDRGMLDINKMGTGEDHFTTETYLANMYTTGINRGVKDYSPYAGDPKMGRFPIVSDGLLLPQYRLPTEEEWEYAAHNAYQLPFKTINNKGDINNYPYGKDYFILEIARSKGMRPDNFKLDDFASNHSSELNELNLPKRMSDINDYAFEWNGVANMQGNVREWVIDAFEEKFNSDPVNTLEVFLAGGFSYPYRTDYDEDMYPIMDRQGYLNYMFFDLGTGADYLKLRKYMPDTSNYRFRVVKGGTWKEPTLESRIKMRENEYRCDVGFRCAMNYLSIPVNPDAKYFTNLDNWWYERTFKYKWNRKWKKQK
ncbi:MAG: SUMF1/EgtB/PvdO family nonheme iron enzyme [Chitinophagales bacterium]|nr:SUMF1/EgtB/PvdO family nonheme iron enzyme [Bacteroidota bacterium]